MVEDGGNGVPPDQGEPLDQNSPMERSRGSGVIFLLVALALILAIGFFYVTKQREKNRDEVGAQAVESVNSAARVVGNAAQSMANQLGN